MTDRDPLDFDVDIPDGGYAWWYLDALSDDGSRGLTIIAFVGSVFSPYYAHARHRVARGDARRADPTAHCAINVALYDRDHPRWSMTERGRGALARDAGRLAIGPSALERIGASMIRLTLDEVAAPVPRRIRGTIDVALGVRPTAQPVALDARGRHAWAVVAPAARVDVSLDRPCVAWSGPAYVDHNRGEVALELDFASWNWSRAHLDDGRTAVAYDVARRDGSALAIARWFDAAGASGALDAPPVAALPRTRWGLDPATRCDAGTVPRRTRVFEDGPFYARSIVESRWDGARAIAVHEHLSLERFRQRWVRALLPFRMPRRG